MSADLPDIDRHSLAMRAAAFCTRCGVVFEVKDRYCAECGAGRYVQSCLSRNVDQSPSGTPVDHPGPVPDPDPDPLAGYHPIEWPAPERVLTNGAGTLAIRITGPGDARAALDDLRTWSARQERLVAAVAHLTSQIEQRLPLLDGQDPD